MSHFPPEMTLAEARVLLRTLAVGGHTCPLCKQYVKIYDRPLPAASARVMVELYRRDEGRQWLYLPEILDTMTGTAHQGGYGTIAQHWGLIEAMPGERPDGSSRVGWWRLNDLGRQFVRGEITVPKKARLYNNHCLRLHGEPWTISDALRTPFNFRELMRGDDE